VTILRKPFRLAVLGLLIVTGLAFAPASFARGGHHHGHWNVSLNFGYPGVGIGYSNWGGGRYYGGYSAPVYYDYGPTYYSYPRYYGSYYYDRPYYRSYNRHRHYDRGYSYDRGYRNYDRGYRSYDRGYRNYDRGYQRANYYDRGYRR
jgi:hypothetical protein